MDQKRLMEIGLDETTAKKVYDELVSDKEKENWIPKHRLDQTTERMKAAEDAKKELEKQLLERDKQLETLSKESKSAEDLKKQIKELQDSNAEEKTKRETAEKEFASKLKATARAAIDDRILTGAKAKNLKSAKALLKDLGDELDNEKYAAEREKEIKELIEAEDSKFMFGTGDFSGLKGRQPGGSGGDPAKTSNRGELAAQRINNEKFPQKTE
ncbi:MAG: phage scaffolding protein [Methanosarcinales archaeon]|jgi:membrane protein involved in colicin uptake|nr:phage scaffolding protein [Methanosarcinales archaeon]